MPWSRGAIALHLVFAVVAAGVLALLSPPRLGLGILALVAAYNLALPAWALASGHTGWFRAWLFVLPISLLQVLPDSTLVNATHTLSFPDLGAPRLLGVPVYMGLMWVIPLLWITSASTATRALLITVLVFGSAELLAEPLRLWAASGVHTLHGAALYVLPAEALLGYLVWSRARALSGAGPLARLAAAAGISLVYTGALLWGWLLIERA